MNDQVLMMIMIAHIFECRRAFVHDRLKVV
jgi:hypothetical protein